MQDDVIAFDCLKPLAEEMQHGLRRRRVVGAGTQQFSAECGGLDGSTLRETQIDLRAFEIGVGRVERGGVIEGCLRSTKLSEPRQHMAAMQVVLATDGGQYTHYNQYDNANLAATK